jgi:cobalt/nickel transport system permease protein
MHIPDGYLSPRSAGALWLVSAPLWAFSLHAIRRGMRRGRVPLVALLAAFSFLIMMFNIPLPGGTTGHAVGAVLVAILVGPWAAVTAVTLALAVQALLFGDGGVLSLGANAFNMAVAMPLAGYAVFRLVKGAARPGDRRFVLAAAAGGYAGINVAALLAAVELGLQPALAHLPDGTPLYCPFPLAVTIPAMTIPHLTVAGAAEATLTAGVVAFLGKHHAGLFHESEGAPT